MEKWDVIVVGAGIGGIACGAILAKRGKRVIVLEARGRVGGRAASFPIMEIPSQLGFHGLSAGGHVEKLLAALGQTVPMVKLEPNFVIYHDERFFEVPGNIDDFARFDYIPEGDRAELVDILRLVERIPLEETDEYDSIGWGDWIREHTGSQAIFDFLALFGNIFITEEFASNIAAGEALRCLSLALKEGGWSDYPKEGDFNAINKAFADVVKGTGGDVRCQVKAREIIVRGNTVRGVTAETAEGLLELEAPIVISNLPVWDIFSLVSPDCFPRLFIDRARFLEEHSQIATTSAMGLTCVSSQPLHSYRTGVLVPCTSQANSTGASYLRWLAVPTNVVSGVFPQGRHLFQYGPVLPRWYVNLLRERRSIYAKEIDGLWREIRQMFPSFKEENILWKGDGVILQTDLSMNFPGNSGKQRLDIKAPGVDGLYFAGDTVRGWGVGCDGAVHSAILCAERILKTKVMKVEGK